MGLEQAIQLVLIVSSLVLSVQSMRLLISSRLKVSLFFSLFFLLIALGNIASLLNEFVTVPSLLLTIPWVGVSVVSLIYVTYVEMKNKLLTWTVIVAGCGGMVVARALPPLAYGIVLSLPVLLLIVHMAVQAKESAAQLLALVRMLLLILSALSVIWAIYLVFAAQVALGATRPYTFSTGLLLTVLALTSFLTPIHTKDAVKQTVY